MIRRAETPARPGLPTRWTLLALLALLALAATTAAPSLAAQEPAPAPTAAAPDTAWTTPPLDPGTPVRIHVADPPRVLRGRLVDVGPDGLRLRRRPPAPDTTTIPLQAIRSLHAATTPPYRSRGFWIGAGIGAGASIIGGILLAGADTDGGGANMAAAGGAVLALPASLLGGLLGAALAPAGWQEIRIRGR